VAQWYARFQFNRRTAAIGLRTNSREAAAGKAADLYKAVQKFGWDAALAKFRGEAPRSMVTVGDYINTAEAILNVRGRSLANYSYALRKIALEATAKRETARWRFNPKRTWARKAETIPLAALTPEAVERWKKDFIQRVGNNPVLQQRARRSVNSYIRNARALFSRRAQTASGTLDRATPSTAVEGVELER
jgi:hypothetical protein